MGKCCPVIGLKGMELFMKKTAVGFLTLLIMISIMAIGFTGCGSSPQGTVDSFFKALQAGDTEGASEFAEEGVIVDAFPVIGNTWSLIDNLYESAEQAGVTVDEELKAPYENFATTLTGAYISSYEIGEFTENEDGTQTANVSLTFAYSGKTISFDYIQPIFKEEWAAYMDEHSSEFADLDNAEMLKRIVTEA